MSEQRQSLSVGESASPVHLKIQTVGVESITPGFGDSGSTKPAHFAIETFIELCGDGVDGEVDVVAVVTVQCGQDGRRVHSESWGDHGERERTSVQDGDGGTCPRHGLRSRRESTRHPLRHI